MDLLLARFLAAPLTISFWPSLPSNPYLVKFFFKTRRSVLHFRRLVYKCKTDCPPSPHHQHSADSTAPKTVKPFEVALGSLMTKDYNRRHFRARNDNHLGSIVGPNRVLECRHVATSCSGSMGDQCMMLSRIFVGQGRSPRLFFFYHHRLDIISQSSKSTVKRLSYILHDSSISRDPHLLT